MSMKPFNITADDLREPVFFQVGYLGQKPHMKQMEVLRSKCKNKVVVCGRRAGKSQMVAGEMIRGGITGEFKSQILIAPTYKQAMIVMTKIVELMNTSDNGDDLAKVIKSPNPRIEFINGSYIDFGSADNPDSLRGENYDRVFLDEAAFIKEGAIDAIRPLIYDTGAPIWFTTTPMGKGIVWDFWERGMNDEDEEYGCFNYCYLDNPYITAEGKKEIEKDIAEWGEESAFVQAEIFGRFVEDRDCYFKRSVVMDCVDDTHYTKQAHPKNRYVMGIDIAAEGEDVSVFYIIELPAFKDKGKVRTVEIRHLSVNKPRDVVGLAVELHDKYNFEKIYTDKTGIGDGPTDWLAEIVGESLVEGVRFSLQSKTDMYSNLKKLMNQQRLEIPTHKKLIHELCELRYERTSTGGMKIHHPDGGKVHDDFPDALALACLYMKDEESNEYESFIM